MIQRIRAIYRDGAFRPEPRCDLAENAEVDLVVQEAGVCEPSVSDRSERLRILRQITERMQSNPLPAGAPRFSRDELHERR
jgi:predicted DNA-binding antitoxin AbrB/MazE fold protein